MVTAAERALGAMTGAEPERGPSDRESTELPG